MTKPKVTIAELMDAYKGKPNVRREVREAERFARRPIAGGNESYRYNVGDSVVSNGGGGLKAGVRFTIEDRTMINGWVKYFGAGLWHRQADVDGTAHGGESTALKK